MTFKDRGIFVLSFALLTLSCEGPSTTNTDANDSANGREIAEFEAYAPFPNATSVRLFVQPRPFEKNDIERLKDDRGRLLSRQEAELLTSAFSKKTVIEPPAGGYEEAACAFMPRHIFRFYDKNDKRLGDAFVCFECYAVELDPRGALREAAFPEKGQSLLSVDYSVLQSLLRQMKVPTYAP